MPAMAPLLGLRTHALGDRVGLSDARLTNPIR
jgi:hypothetical protein